MEVLIDVRERDLIELIGSTTTSEDVGFDFKIEQLDIGDIHFVNRETKELFMVIERKTYSDLSSSVTDGRYREQKQRLLHSIPQNVRKVYVFEGDKIRDFHLDKSIFDGIMINTVIRDKIMVYKTRDLMETFEFMKHVRKNIETHMEDYEGDGNGTNMEYTIIKSVKKENMCRKTVFKGMLSLIPQISKTISDVLYDRYENMDNFIQQIKELGEGDWLKMMRVISEEKYGANQRRIGDVTAKKILLYLFHMSEEDKNMIEDDGFGKKVKKGRKKLEDIRVEDSPSKIKKSIISRKKKVDDVVNVDITTTTTSNSISLFSED